MVCANQSSGSQRRKSEATTEERVESADVGRSRDPRMGTRNVSLERRAFSFQKRNHIKKKKERRKTGKYI